MCRPGPPGIKALLTRLDDPQICGDGIRQASNSNQESPNTQKNTSIENSRDGDGDGEMAKSDASTRSTVYITSAYGHTNEDEGDRASSGSEYEDEVEEQSQETYFDPGRFQQLDEAMGE
ncbi:hypothetical protein PGTUg99_001663 [Puccinia graminis f. sp. tritici]|uniref:Uncharacterized protein n=1 Tax=Puccinia graminis f. sp. tritici TaxID=56615 RepID=A0A5B0QZN8_PUCGR|nr:hypothetical protein PGTUg99_010936 [Puccinia graminis f. sp. tritici]KAA1129917.1 hypothetical protein PGTUg99_001663 [Puccinia graminis f. sp. tritici]